MDGLDEDSVAFRETYNGEEEEPEVFPAAFPNLLANGASGIAVGMATSIPPHNVAEIADAAVALLDNPDASVDELMQHLKGPDFPTGGVVVEPATRDPVGLRHRAAAASACARAGSARTCRRACGRSRSPRSRIRSRRAS